MKAIAWTVEELKTVDFIVVEIDLFYLRILLILTNCIKITIDGLKEFKIFEHNCPFTSLVSQWNDSLIFWNQVLD